MYELLEIWLNQLGFNGNVKTAATAVRRMIYGLAEQWSRDRNAEGSSPEQFAHQVLQLVAVNL